MKQGISDSDHAALIAGAYKFHARALGLIVGAHKFPKRELGLIDNTEMGALNPMSLAEVQNKITREEVEKLAFEYGFAKGAYMAVGIIHSGDVEQDLEREAVAQRYHAASNAYQSALRRYQEQTK